MKVLHVIDSAQRRGAEVFAGDLIRALNDAGIEQRVAVLEGWKPVAVSYDAPVTLLSRGPWGVPGLRVHPKTIWGLRSLIASWKPEIVQSHGGDSLKYSVLATLGKRTRLVYRDIGMAPPWITHGPRRRAYDWLIHRTDRVIAIAEPIRREVVDLFRIPPDRTVIIPNGVDARRMDPVRRREETRMELGISPDAPVILSVAALTWEKDPLAHIEIARRVFRKRPDVVHLIAGDGPMRPEAERAVRDLGLLDAVRLVGVRADVADLFSASDVLLFASRTDGMEGMPAVVIEAGLAGLPVAGYAVAGVGDVVLDGITGLLVPPGNLEQLAASAASLLDDEYSRRRMGEAARDRCLALFDIERVAPQYQELYEQLLIAS